MVVVACHRLAGDPTLLRYEFTPGDVEIHSWDDLDPAALELRLRRAAALRAREEGGMGDLIVFPPQCTREVNETGALMFEHNRWRLKAESS